MNVFLLVFQCVGSQLCKASVAKNNKKGAAPPADPNPAADAAPAAAAPAAAPALIYYPRCIEHISFSVITVRSASAT